MNKPLAYWQLEPGMVVRTGGGPSDIVRLVAKTPRYTTRDTEYDVVKMNGSKKTEKLFFEPTEDDLRKFLLDNQIPGMPDNFSETNPQGDIDRLEQEIADIQVKLQVIKQYAKLRKEREAAVKRKAAKASKKDKEAQALEMFEDVEVGDLVRVVGTRNPLYPWRQVISKDDSQFSGVQYAKIRDRKNDRWVWKMGSHMTTTMANKIREVVKQAEHGLDFP